MSVSEAGRSPAAGRASPQSATKKLETQAIRFWIASLQASLLSLLEQYLNSKDTQCHYWSNQLARLTEPSAYNSSGTS